MRSRHTQSTHAAAAAILMDSVAVPMCYAFVGSAHKDM